jgi:serine/threonine protein kinase
MSLDLLWKWARNLVSALNYIHVKAKVIHRDIKPDNLMINKKDELVLVDFGIGIKFQDENDVMKGTQGTMRFYAPEIVKSGVKDKKVHGR